MSNYLKQRLEHEALKAEREQEIKYWDKEYSGDIELGRAKLRIKELEQELTSFNHLKSISWNLNRIANVLEGKFKSEEPKEDIAANLRALIKTGWLWPRLVTPIPLVKSRYLVPSEE